ncbi:GNAT family N-acetyltransferase [Aeromonas caviae]|uniref:GNAT family N-acetyltransferase n=1 Tax=Aeromonas caviae TaxID=648 RepID=UPI0005A6C9BE|nr:GNAT family N-acetyltransferase [Aeromonas caviae]MBL0486591.1 GNAT family N-acetyltransferase [Aeromonas caviae]MBS4634990.1 GNAT family N-acetyltransferase [Aeromonas caviae]WQD87664.1 GNAT family N-acetyltransferase [Aeromonas caviae]SQH60133.1 acetyltransferase [Aeromonas caviae]
MPSLSSPRIVPLEEAHIPRLLDLFEKSVRRLGPAHYSPEQVEQWARGAHHPGLASQLREHHGWVIEQDDVPLGFATLSDDGHLSLLYVSADHPRQGLGTLLLERVLAAASQMGLGSLTTEASAFSLALFLRHGFLLTGLETVERGGVQFIRHRLHCRLP